MFLTIRYAIISFLMIASITSSNNNLIKATTIAKLPVEGVASFYADQFHGRTTANGEIFDLNDLTCAHPSLPFGTMLKVTHLGNNQSVVVRVNDRGPYVDAREIDLSFAAATQLGMTADGISPVKIELATITQNDITKAIADSVLTKRVEKSDLFTCQIGVFVEESNAERIIEKCEDLHLAVFTQGVKVNNLYGTRILIGRLKNRDQAEELAEELKNLKFDEVIIKKI